MFIRIFTIGVMVACCTSVFADPLVMTPTGTWSGKNQDETLRQLAPESGFITDQEVWKKLWTAWRPDEELPKVDFSQELILAGTVDGPNLARMSPTLDEGDVKFLVIGTKIGGPGFGYQLIKVSREGIKTINGTALELKGVQGVLIIPKTLDSFEGHTLEVKLWEYDPRLADASAKLIDKLTLSKYSHRQGEDTVSKLALGTDLKPRQDRGYYLTVFVVQDGKRTHIGERDGKRGLCKVLTDGKPTQVKLIARSVR